MSKNIPTVAEQTQGEVVKFAAAAAQQMGEAGLIVLLEGREATVNYIPSPYVRRVGLPLMNRGDAAAATWIVRGDGVAATPRPRRG